MTGDKKTKKVDKKTQPVEQTWQGLIGVAESSLDIDLAFLDGLDDNSFKDEVVRLPYEGPAASNLWRS